MMRQSLEMRCVPEKGDGRFKGQQARQEIKQTTIDWCRKMPLAFSQDIKRKAWGRVIGANWNSEGTLACPRNQNSYSQVRRILNSKNPTDNLDTYKVVGASLVDLGNIQALLRSNGQHELSKALQLGPLRFPEPFEDGDIDGNIERWAAASLIKKKTLYKDLTPDVIQAIYSFECGLAKIEQRTGNGRMTDKNISGRKTPSSTTARPTIQVVTPEPAAKNTTNNSVNAQPIAKTTTNRIGTSMKMSHKKAEKTEAFTPYRTTPTAATKTTNKKAGKAEAFTSYEATRTATMKTTDKRAVKTEASTPKKVTPKAATMARTTTPSGSRPTGTQLPHSRTANPQPITNGTSAPGFVQRQNPSATLDVSRLKIGENDVKSASTTSQAKQTTPNKNDVPWAFYGNSAPPGWK